MASSTLILPPYASHPPPTNSAQLLPPVWLKTLPTFLSLGLISTETDSDVWWESPRRARCGSPLSLYVVFSGPERSFRTRKASPDQRSVFIREAASALASNHSRWESLPSQGSGHRGATDRKRCALKCDEVGKGTSREARMFQGWASLCHVGTVIPATPMRKLREETSILYNCE